MDRDRAIACHSCLSAVIGSSRDACVPGPSRPAAPRAEDGAVRTYSQRERYDRHCGEQRGMPELPACVPAIRHQLIEQPEPECIAALFLPSLCASEIDARTSARLPQCNRRARDPLCSSRCESEAHHPTAAPDPSGERCRASTIAALQELSRFVRASLQDSGNDVGHAVPVASFLLQLAPPCRRQAIESRPALVLGFAPLALDEPLVLEAIQRGIQRALLNFEALAGALLDAQQDTVAMQRSERDRLENQHVERTLEQSGGLGHVSP